MVVCGVVVTGIGLGLDYASLHQSAADAARAASLGLPDSDVLSRIRATYGPDVTVEIDRDHQLHVVCVLLEGPLRRTAGIDWFHPSSEMCALLPPELTRT